jgi:hypothetical protein
VPPNTVQAILAPVGHTVGFKELRLLKYHFTIHSCQMIKANMSEVEAVTWWQLAWNSGAVTGVGG